MPSPVVALTGWSAWKLPSVAACFICDAMCPVFSRSILLTRDDHRHAEREDVPRDVAVAGADALARAEDEQDHVDVVGDRLVHGHLHPLGQRVDRPLPARQVDQHELRLVGRVDAADAVARRVRLVGDDRDLRAGEGVHERRLADVRASGDGDEARLHSGRFQVSGSSSLAPHVAIVPSSRRKLTSGIRHSCSHWRQPPHGEAVIPIAAISPGLTPAVAAAPSAVFSAQMPSG